MSAELAALLVVVVVVAVPLAVFQYIAWRRGDGLDEPLSDGWGVRWSERDD